jgi:pilus assembly protein CpaB
LPIPISAWAKRVLEQDLRWQTWPTTAAGPNFIRKSDRPEAIRELTGSIARSPFFSGEPIRESKLIKAKGSGYMAAILPSGMRNIGRNLD